MINISTLTDNLDVIATRLDESSQMALAALTGDTRIIDYNSGFANLIKRSDSLKDVDLKTLLLPESRTAFDKNLDKRSPLQLNFSLSDNNSLALQCTFHPTRTGYLMFGEQPILADSQVMRTMSVLNNELAGLTREQNRNNRALKELQLQLQKKNADIEEFASIIAHDFKSPLITINSFITLMEQDLARGNSAEIEANLSYIRGGAKRLELLLGGLEKITSVVRKDNTVEKIRFTDLIISCLAALAGTLRQREINVTVKETPLELTGDPLPLGQIWQNLIENAVKYMGDQRHAQIDVGIDEETPTPVFFVRDNGMGIAPKHRERIFNLFSQLNPGSDGSGLGLALVKKIVTIYGGRIWVESAGVGQGSCFMFTLPGALNNHEPITGSEQQ